MTIKNGRKFREEFKKLVKGIYDSEGLEEAFTFARDHAPDIQLSTLKTWVNEEYNQTKQQIRREQYNKWKSENPEKYQIYSERRKTQQRNALRNNNLLRDRQYERTKQWRSINSDYSKNYSKHYWIKAKNRQLARKRERRKTDVCFRMVENLRSYLYNLLKKAINFDATTRKESTSQLIGCSRRQLLDHLRAQYKPGMTDENYGQWHIDHIKPCSLFDLTLLEQRRECFHYTNLQPLWACENLAKGDKY